MNETKIEYGELSRKLTDLEHEYRSDKKLIKGAAIVFIVLLAAFFGFSLSQIGNHVDKALSSTAVKEAEKKAAEFAEKAEDALNRIAELEDKHKKLLEQISKDKTLVPIYRYKASDPYRELLSKNDNLGHGWTKINDPYFHVLQ